MRHLAWMLAVLTGCEGVVTVVQPVDITGTIASADGHDGPVFVEVYQAWAGDGDLRYPMRFVDGVRVETPGDFTMQVALPVNEGEGMVLYGWQDKDGDEAFCRPGVDDELSGVTVVSEGAVSDTVDVDLILDAACLGATRLFP